MYDSSSNDKKSHDSLYTTELVIGKEEASDASLTVAEISWERKSISPCLIKRKKSNKAT